MTTVRYYASDYDHANPDGWTNPANIVGAADDVCTEKIILIGSFYRKLQVYFSINIPSGAVITDERINCKGTWTADQLSDAGIEIVYTSQGGYNIDHYTSCGRGTTVCLGSQYSGVGLSLGPGPYLISRADLNSGNYVAKIYVKGGGLASNTHAYLDAVYLEVDYALPSIGGALGDGLTCVALLQRTRRRTKALCLGVHRGFVVVPTLIRGGNKTKTRIEKRGKWGLLGDSLSSGEVIPTSPTSPPSNPRRFTGRLFGPLGSGLPASF